MKREEITIKVEENLCKIRVGDEFPTQRKLFAALDIPDDGNGNKTVKSIVSSYIKWESLSSGSKKIRVVEIIENPQYVDGRSNNGGAHNEKYGKIIKPALLSYTYDEPITFRQIFENIYGFEDGFFDRTFSSKEKHKREYFDYFKSYLKSITKSALDSLQNKKYIQYREVYMIRGENQNITFEDCNITESTSLYELLRYICENHYAPIGLNEFLRSFSEKVKFSGENIDLQQMTVFDFVKTYLKETKRSGYYNLIDEFLNLKYADRPIIASQAQTEFIIATEEALCKHFKYNRKEIGYNSAKAGKVYRWAGVIYKLLGWKSVWKAFDITVLNKGDGLKEYPLTEFSYTKLLETLEPQIEHWATELKVINPEEVEKKRYGNRKPTIGKMTIIAPDEDFPYLAFDREVNKLHCQIFGHQEIDEKYLINVLKTKPN